MNPPYSPTDPSAPTPLPPVGARPASRATAPEVVLTALQQLEAAREAGVVTPEVFATLAAQLPTPAPAPEAPLADEVVEPPPLPPLVSLAGSFATPATEPAAAAPLVAVRPLAAAAQPVAHQPAGSVIPPEAAPLPSPRSAGAAPFRPAAPADVRPVAAPVTMAPRNAGPTAPEAAAAEAPARRSSLSTLLASVGGLGLLGAGIYLYTDRAHPDEQLSSRRPTPTEQVAAAASPPHKPDAPVTSRPKTIRVTHTPSAPPANRKAKKPTPAPTTPAAHTAPMATHAPTPAPAPVPASHKAHSKKNPSPAVLKEAPMAVPAAPEPGDDEATRKIRSVLAGYYADLLAPPLSAAQYFAPQVERLYLQRNLTPAQIDASTSQHFFPENKQAVFRIEPGSLRVSPPVKDGSRTATYTEAGRLFRVSRGRHQRLRTEVRVRFDAAYRITFMRQEKMLENTFE